MAKGRLTAKNVLSKEEYEELKRLRKETKRRELRKETNQLSKSNTFFQRQEKRDATTAGKIGNLIGKRFQLGQVGLTRSLYRRENPPNMTKTGGVKTGKRGRPKGSYAPKYARFGGVYGYRKWLRNQLKIKRIQALKQNTLNPRQQQIFEQIKRRDEMARLSPENKTFPDTYGDVPLGGIMDEIKKATNLVP